jgi:hypothetical protein
MGKYIRSTWSNNFIIEKCVKEIATSDFEIQKFAVTV